MYVNRKVLDMSTAKVFFFFQEDIFFLRHSFHCLPEEILTHFSLTKLPPHYILEETKTYGVGTH